MTIKIGKMYGVPFEQALDETGVGRFNVVLMVFCATIIIAMGFETNSVAYLVPLSACELKTTSVQQGIMAGVPLLGILFTSNIWGYLADRRGRRKMLLYALILGFFTGCSATLAPDWIAFCILKFLSSSAMAGTFGLANTYVSECIPISWRFKLIVSITSVFLASIGSMAALTIPVYSLTFSYYIPYLDIHFNSWRLLNIIYSLPCLIAAVGAVFAYESPKYLLSVGENEKALVILKKMFVMNTGMPENLYKVGSVVFDENVVKQESAGFMSSFLTQTVPLFKPPLLRNTLLLFVLYVIVYFSMSPFSIWMPSMLHATMESLEMGRTELTFCQMMQPSHNETSSGVPEECSLNEPAMMMVFFMNLIQAVLNAVVCVLLPYVGRKSLLIGIQLVTGLAGVGVNFSTNWVLSDVLIVVFVSGILNFGVLASFAVDLFPTYVKAMGVCLSLMVGRGSAILGINLLKQMLFTNCEGAFYFFGSLTIVGGFFGFLLPSEKSIATFRFICLGYERDYDRS